MATWGSRGDFQPYLALSLGLQAAGHDVQLASPNANGFDSAARAVGVEFTDLGGLVDTARVAAVIDDMSRSVNPIAHMRRLIDEFLAPELESMYRALLPLAEWSDIVVTHMVQWAGFMAAERAGRPVVSGSLAHAGIPSRHWVPAPLPYLGPLITDLCWRAVAGFVSRSWGPPINAERVRLGFAPIPNFAIDGLYSRSLNLIAVSPTIATEQPDWAPRHRVTGYWFLDRPEWTPPSDLAAFMDDGPPPVVISFGSMATAEAEATTRLLYQTADRASVRAVIQAGVAGLGTPSPPSNVFIAGDVPHDWLFPKARLVVHHGGAGTSAAVFRAGVPHVYVPHIADQNFWAKTARSLGVAGPSLWRRSLTSSALADRIRATAANDSMHRRARDLAARIHTEDGVGVAVRLIEQAHRRP